MTEHEVGLNVQVKVTVNNEDAVLRCTENRNDEGAPQEDVRGGAGWRNSYYPLMTREQVLEHWAFNAVANGVEDASTLDGWGDLERGDVTMRVQDVQLDWVS